MNLETLFDNLEKRRKALGISKAELARQTGISRRGLYKYWARLDMPAVVFFRMLQVLRCDVELTWKD